MGNKKGIRKISENILETKGKEEGKKRQGLEEEIGKNCRGASGVAVTQRLAVR